MKSKFVRNFVDVVVGLGYLMVILATVGVGIVSYVIFVLIGGVLSLMSKCSKAGEER